MLAHKKSFVISGKRSIYATITFIAAVLAIFVFITGTEKLPDFHIGGKKKNSGDHKYRRELMLPKNKSVFDDYTGVYIKNDGIPSTSSVDLLLTIIGKEPMAVNVDVGYAFKFKRDEMEYRLLVTEVDFEKEFVKIILCVE